MQQCNAPSQLCTPAADRPYNPPLLQCPQPAAAAAAKMAAAAAASSGGRLSLRSPALSQQLSPHSSLQLRCGDAGVTEWPPTLPLQLESCLLGAPHGMQGRPAEKRRPGAWPPWGAQHQACHLAGGTLIFSLRPPRSGRYRWTGRAGMPPTFPTLLLAWQHQKDWPGLPLFAPPRVSCRIPRRMPK